MKTISLIISLHVSLLILSCGLNNKSAHIDEKLIKNKSILSNHNQVMSISHEDIYDSLYNTFECEDDDINISAKLLESELDSLLVNFQKDLRKSNKDTSLINPLLELLLEEQKQYKLNIKNSADMIYWSYGVASMNGERKVARNCFYLKELQRKKILYLSIINKVKGSLLDL